MNEINEAFDAMFKELQKTGDTYAYPDAARSVIEECKKVVQSRIDEYERESHEQCRIIGMSAERELRMVAKMEHLDKERSKYQKALAYARSYGSESWSEWLINEVDDTLGSNTVKYNKETNA